MRRGGLKRLRLGSVYLSEGCVDGGLQVVLGDKLAIGFSGDDEAGRHGVPSLGQACQVGAFAACEVKGGSGGGES